MKEPSTKQQKKVVQHVAMLMTPIYTIPPYREGGYRFLSKFDNHSGMMEGMDDAMNAFVQRRGCLVKKDDLVTHLLSYGTWEVIGPKVSSMEHVNVGKKMVNVGIITKWPKAKNSLL